MALPSVLMLYSDMIEVLKIGRTWRILMLKSIEGRQKDEDDFYSFNGR